MTFVVRSALLLILSGLFSIHSHANSALLNHAQAAFQAMSALYMKALSEGSPKYQSDLDKYKAQAVESLRVLQQQTVNTQGPHSVMVGLILIRTVKTHVMRF